MSPYRKVDSMFSIYRRYKFTREAVCSYRAISTDIRAQSREDPEGILARP